MELAEQDGFEAVRLRDLAQKADVALGTVYRRFSSKEDILAAALELETSKLQTMLSGQTIPGAGPHERVMKFFGFATQVLTARPKLSQAMLRVVASGQPELAEKVTRYHGTMTDIIRDALRGAERAATRDPRREDAEHDVALILQGVWFAALVGWTDGLHGPEAVVMQLERATELLLAGLDATIG